ncbi:DUF4446 family protein [Marmoricola sp. RAF53]|uniref:DUF4446 family protein n=1 Tax=Marmoricola sp. RAF53 TaxID=3233059 RepID=UPI003F9D5960
MNTVLSVLALLVALASLGLVLQQRRAPGATEPGDVSDLPEDALGLRHEVAALRAEAATALQHLAVVRYDAYARGSDANLGGALSWSLALLDDHGDGTVITSIHGRSEARTYAKTISAWRCDQPLSPEEEEAVGQARG